MSECQLAERQFKLAWEHFKFHAEQRTKMFNFFLLAVTLLVNAFSSMLTGNKGEYASYAPIILSIGGFMSTMFFALDVRNTQLISHSEDLLRKIENDLYPVAEWHQGVEGNRIRLGLLSREAVLEKHIKRNTDFLTDYICRWFWVDNIKHTLSIRLIVMVSTIAFWATAVAMTCEKSPWFGLNVIFSLACLAWVALAMGSPKRDLEREQEAWKKAAQDAAAAVVETRKAESAMARATAELEAENKRRADETKPAQN